MTSSLTTQTVPFHLGLLWLRPRRRWRLSLSAAADPVQPRRPGRLRLSRRARHRSVPGTAQAADPEIRFAQLYDDHWDDLHRYCQRRCASSVDADDALAETFTIAWRRIADIPDGPAARPWLFVVARNLLSEHYRRGDWTENITNRLRAELATAVPVAVPGQDSDRDNLDVALQALLHIDDADRELIELVAWDGVSHKEAAEILDCSVNAVAIRLSRARSRLQLKFDEMLRETDPPEIFSTNLKGPPDISHVHHEEPNSEEGNR